MWRNKGLVSVGKRTLVGRWAQAGRLRQGRQGLHLVLLAFLFFCAPRNNDVQSSANISYPSPLPDSGSLPFLPGIVSTDSIDFGAAFSPDGRSFYFSRKQHAVSEIYTTRFDGSAWTPVVLISSAGDKFSDADPAFGPDGNLYFISNRPKDELDSLEDYDIWRIKPLKHNLWSVPERLEEVNSDSSEYFVSFTKAGDLYFSSSRGGGFGKEDIYVSRFISGGFTKPENVGSVINTVASEYDPGISPDESLMVFASSNRSDSFGGADLYYSKRNNEGTWSGAVNLGSAFNTTTREYCAYFSPDMKYLFYSSDSDVKWVSVASVMHAPEAIPNGTTLPPGYR